MPVTKEESANHAYVRFTWRYKMEEMDEMPDGITI
jgi:hypothetical protein